MHSRQGNEKFEMLRAIEGLRCGRAITILVWSSVAACVIVAMGVTTESMRGVAIFGLLGILAWLFGVSSAGVVLMDVARGIPATPIGSALVLGIWGFFKMVVMLILMLLVSLAILVVIGALFYICKLPGVGPLLYAFVLPIVIIFGAMAIAGMYVAFNLLACAIWEGNTIRGSIARLFAIGRSRPVEALVQFVSLYGLAVLIGLIVVSFLFVSGFTVSSVSVMALGVGMNTSDIASVGQALFSGTRGVGGYVLAGLFGIGTVWAVSSAALLAVLLMGANLVYLQASSGLDATAAEEGLEAGIALAKQKAESVKEAARQRARDIQERARKAAEERRTAVEAATVSQRSTALVTCSQCGEPISNQDAFCGQCGHRRDA